MEDLLKMFVLLLMIFIAWIIFEYWVLKRNQKDVQPKYVFVYPVNGGTITLSWGVLDDGSLSKKGVVETGEMLDFDLTYTMGDVIFELVQIVGVDFKTKTIVYDIKVLQDGEIK